MDFNLKDRKKRVQKMAKTIVKDLVALSWNCYEDALNKGLHSKPVELAVHDLLYSYIDKVQSVQPGCLTIKLIVSDETSLKSLISNLKRLATSVQEAVFLEATRKLKQEFENNATLPETGKSVVKFLIFAVISHKFRVKLSISESDVKNFYAGTNQEITLTISTTSFYCSQRLHADADYTTPTVASFPPNPQHIVSLQNCRKHLLFLFAIIYFSRVMNWPGWRSSDITFLSC